MVKLPAGAGRTASVPGALAGAPVSKGSRAAVVEVQNGDHGWGWRRVGDVRGGDRPARWPAVADLRPALPGEGHPNRCCSGARLLAGQRGRLDVGSPTRGLAYARFMPAFTIGEWQVV